MSIDELTKGVKEARLLAHYWRQKAYAMYGALCELSGQYREILHEEDCFTWEEPNPEDFKNCEEIKMVDWDEVESENDNEDV